MKMSRENIKLACACLSLIAVAASSDAQESGWFSGLLAQAEHERSSASALDSSRLEPSAGGPEWSAAVSAPWSSGTGQVSITADPVATLQLSSPAATITAFNWKIGAGAIASLSSDPGASSFAFSMGPLLAFDTELRLAGAAAPPGASSERLKAIELEGRLRVNERTAMNRVLEAAGLAARSAAALADAEHSEAKAAYLAKDARRVELELGEGRQSMASYAEARDLWERARLDAESFRSSAEAFGREARAASLSPPPETSSAFAADGIFGIGAALAGLCAGSDPAAPAVADATSPWDLRIAELAVQALSEAPTLSASLKVQAMPQATTSRLLPSMDGTLGLAIPFSFSAARHAKKAAGIEALRREAAATAAVSASLRFDEAERVLDIGRKRIASLEAHASERKARADAWSRLASDGTATTLDVLAALASLAEARASLDREKAGYFLSAIVAFAASGLPMSSLATATDTVVSGSPP